MKNYIRNKGQGVPMERVGCYTLNLSKLIQEKVNL